jgi:FMN phosphatase YigB (HAD superfamily)
MKIIVVDLDGTLCDSAHRDHLAQAKEWDRFHEAAKDDQPREDVAFFLRMTVGRMTDEFMVIACTGRNERYRQATLRWLIDKDLAVFDAILMRPDGDWRPDVEMKPVLLHEFMSSLDVSKGVFPKVAFILEDRDKVVEAWRNLGYKCWQVQPGGY